MAKGPNRNSKRMTKHEDAIQQWMKFRTFRKRNSNEPVRPEVSNGGEDVEPDFAHPNRLKHRSGRRS